MLRCNVLYICIKHPLLGEELGQALKQASITRDKLTCVL